MDNKIVNFEGQEVKVITDEGKVLYNLVNNCKILGIVKNTGKSIVVNWRTGNANLISKLNRIKSGTNVPTKYKDEIEYLLNEIDNTEDRNSIYMSSWMTKRLCMECKNDKAMQYKNFLATLDEQREQGLISTDTKELVNMVTNTVNAIIPQIVQQFVPMIQESKDQVEKSRKLLIDQSNIYEADRNKIKESVGMKGVNVTYATNKLKLVLSDYLGEKIMATDEIYREAKLRVLCSLDCAKWEDIPMNRINELNNKIDNIIELFSKPLEIKDINIHNKLTKNRKSIRIETTIKNGIKYQKCTCCGEWKIMSEKNFYKSNSSTGFKGTCIKCKKNYYKDNRLVRLAYQNAKAHKEGTIPRSNYSFNKINMKEGM